MSQSLFDRNGRTLRCIAARVRNADELYLFLDYDGTLAPLRKTPRKAILSTRARSLLLKLKELRGTTLGVITGRSLEDIKKLLRLRDIVIAASHGFEILIGTDLWVHPKARNLHTRLAFLANILSQRLQPIPRLLIENKRSTLSIHYRNVPSSRVREVRKTVEAVVHPYRLSVNITSGKKVIEIRPKVSWGKGHALRKILEAGSGSRNRLVVFCGDDVTDEDAFRLLPDDAVTVRVGEARDTKARFQVQRVSDVYKLLRMINTERRKRGTQTAHSKKS
jgi:trehalose-phosphatase